jgi:hypothetical protein
VSLQLPAQRPGPHLQLGRLNRVAGATRLGLHFGVLHLQQAQILNPSTLNPSTFNSQSGSNLPGSCPQPSPCLVGGTGSLGAHRPEPRSMPCAIVVGSRPQPRGCLQGLQPSRHPHVHLNPPVLHCMATTFSVTPAQLKKKAPPPHSFGWPACWGPRAVVHVCGVCVCVCVSWITGRWVGGGGTPWSGGVPGDARRRRQPRRRTT